MGKLAKMDEVLYHTGLTRRALQGAKYAVLPGDPGRVTGLAEGLGVTKELALHREYKSALADLQGVPVLVCSTGMGGPSVAICLEELAKLGITHFVRVGTTGSLQEHINLGDLIINKAAVRLEGTSRHYAPLSFPAVADLAITNALVAGAKQEKYAYHVGIGVTSDTFWPGQERYDSFTGYVPRDFQGTLKEWQQLGATNYEMEVAALFVVAQSFGLAAGAVCGVVAKRTTSEKVAPASLYAKVLPKMITTVKNAILLLSERQV